MRSYFNLQAVAVKVGVSAPGADTAVICSKITEGFAARRRGTKVCRLRESTQTPPQGVEVSRAHQHRESLRARVQPGCTKKRYAIKPGLIVCVRGKNPPAVTTTETRPRPGLDENKWSRAPQKERQRKQHKLRKSRSGTETLQEMSAGQTSDTTRVSRR
ncbi:hypothetical protein GQ600_22378 [Phytophthora cactorum]|nr:hypothetical protein GQ600_22378 [Phytophthora cactorum]